ncbi:MAG: hypothetical protein NT150_04655 [Bacteroidetes bacterium]|nr:hypothetical protein [Bacteroidota bacterium]
MGLLDLFKKKNTPSDRKYSSYRNQWSQRIENLEEVYGTDARPIIYATTFNLGFFKRFEAALYLRELDTTATYQNDFSKKNSLNFPGPFYTLETDNCGTGQPEAPENILCDHEGREHIFMQPQTTKELCNILTASLLDPFHSYAVNGNEHWNLQLIKEWWRNKHKLIDTLLSKEFEENNSGQNFKYIEYLNGQAKEDLQRYAYFLENGKYPVGEGFVLPEID